VRLALCCKQLELLEHGFILLQDNATPHHNHDVQILVQQWGWNMLAYPSYSPYLTPCDYWLFEHMKENLRGSVNELNWKMTSTLSLPLYIV
jgi:hypothetical protein